MFESYQDWIGEIERLGWGGVGIARNHDGRLILLRSNLAIFPGETVEAKLHWKSRHAEGIVASWRKSDRRRCVPECPVAEKCGGCSLWGAGKFAAELKKMMAHDLLKRAFGEQVQFEWIPAPEGVRRSRIQLHFDGKRVGYAKRKSNEIVEVEYCPMAEKEISSAIPHLLRALIDNSLSGKHSRWELDCGHPANGAFLHPTGERKMAFKLENEKWLPTNERIEYFFSSGRMSRTIGTFFQACPEWAFEAFSRLFEKWNIRGETLFDVYGGCGFVSFILKSRFKKFIIVESDADACNDARRNLEGLEAEIFEMSAVRWLEAAQDFSEGILFFDPPRSGLGSEMVELVCRSNVGNIILIGCDGAAFARDAKLLLGSFEIANLAAIDLFPNTFQVEFAGKFVR